MHVVSDADLERLVRPLADELELRNMVARAGWAADGDDSEAFAALFVEDGVFVLYGRPVSPRSAIAAMHAAGAKRRGPESTGHATVNVVVEVDGDRAHVKSYLNDARTRYLDDWIRVDGRWLLERRELHGRAPDGVFEALLGG
jgi:uncharacterized protein (TIGR02246 family)